MVTLEDVLEKRKKYRKIRSIVRIVEDRREEKRRREAKKKKEKEKDARTEAEESFCSLLLFWSGLFFF